MKMLKTLLTALLLAFSAAALAADNVGNIEVIVHVKDDSGQVFASLFNKAENFPSGDEPALKTVSAKQQDGKARLVFENVPYGDYAIAVHHDQDGNGKMKTVYGTIPLEGFGVSRDAKGVRGPPKFDDAKFRLDSASVALEVHVNY